MQILTFDLGGTLMEYTGMPDSWTDYYKQGFEAIAHYYHCNISAFHIEKSIEILCSFNQIATLTDLPTAMPDKLFQKDIAQLLPYFDFYVSSLSCGFRKPAIRGLQMISEHFGIPITELIFLMLFLTNEKSFRCYHLILHIHMYLSKLLFRFHLSKSIHFF